MRQLVGEDGVCRVRETHICWKHLYELDWVAFFVQDIHTHQAKRVQRHLDINWEINEYGRGIDHLDIKVGGV